MDIFEELEEQNINKKEIKEKFSSENVFHELKLDDTHTKSIHSKIDKLRDAQINDLKLINIRIEPKHSIVTKKSESSRLPNETQTFSSTNNKNFNEKWNYFINDKNINKKKEIKLFPYINKPKINKVKLSHNINLTEEMIDSSKNLDKKKNLNFSNYKSKVYISLNNEIKNKIMSKHKNNINKFYNNTTSSIDEEKIFLTKIDNNRNRNSINSINSFSKKFYIANKKSKFNNITFDKNGKNKTLCLKDRNKTYYSPKKIFYDNTEAKTDKKEKENNILNLNNKIVNTDNSEEYLEKEDRRIYELLKKNERLNDFLNKKFEKKRNKTFNKIKHKKKISITSSNFRDDISSFSKRMSLKSKNSSNNKIARLSILSNFEDLYSSINKRIFFHNKNNSSNNNYFVNMNELTLEKNEQKEENEEENEKNEISNLENQIKALYLNFPRLSKFQKDYNNYLKNLNNISKSNISHINNKSNFNNSINIIENYIKDFNISKISTNSPSFNEIIELFKNSKIRATFLNNLKDKQKLKRFLYFSKANNLLENFKKDFIDLNDKLKDDKKDLLKMKNKWNNILHEIDKKNNFNLNMDEKEFEKKEIYMSFAVFFENLLMLIKNYDKKIKNSTFKIKKESNEQPLDVKYSTVTKKHEEFMDLLEKQFIEGKNMKNLLKKCLLKRKEELEKENNCNCNYNQINEKMKNQTNYQKKFFNKK